MHKKSRERGPDTGCLSRVEPFAPDSESGPAPEIRALWQRNAGNANGQSDVRGRVATDKQNDALRGQYYYSVNLGNFFVLHPVQIRVKALLLE